MIKVIKKGRLALVSIFIILGLILNALPIIQAQEDSANNVSIYFFWGEGCPHCADEKPFLESLQNKYPTIEVHSYETWYNSENAKLFSEMAEAFGTRVQGVPTTFIDSKVWTGYSNYMDKEIEDKIIYCLSNYCVDPIEKLKQPSEVEISESESDISIKPENISSQDPVVRVPFFGEINASKMSLPIFTIILAGVDSFNPCAFFVLFFLLSMLIYAKSRKRMLLIGGTFVLFSAVIYFLFMSAWLNIFLIIGNLAIITTIAGIVALFIAGINIKDFFFFEKGVSLVIPEKAKPKLFERMRNLLKAESLFSMMIGTIVLAVSANMYEMLCTAGFPMVFTRILTLNNLSPIQYYLYLVLYNLIYVIPLAIIVLMFTITLGAKKLTEWQGQVLKLISGMMMLCLGGVLLFNPALLNNVLISIGLLATALILTGIIILITKKIKGRENLEIEESAKINKTKKSKK